jgi:cbb3-type cytochrome oxidase subunit 1
MDWFVKAFMKASLTWLALGVTLGVAMAAYPAWVVYRPAHLHMLVLGFVTMMIFGVAYHVVPRFTGHPLYSRRAAGWHWWVSNAGLLLMALGFIMRPHAGNSATPVLTAGGVLAASGAYLFAYLIWRTIDGPVALRRAARETAARARAQRGAQLPLADADQPPAVRDPRAS